MLPSNLIKTSSSLNNPAIGFDGTIYCGANDEYIYALYPNGTLRWKFNAGNWVHGSPSIADDGTVYIGSDAHLFALYPNNGTMKWKLDIGAIWGSPAIGENGIIYVGVWEEKFYAIYPNGTIKWIFEDCNQVWWTSASLSNDGKIYFGSNIDIEDMEGGELIALNSDGTEYWRISIAYDWIFSTPAIGEDGTIYIGSVNDGYHPGSWGYLHAIGELNPNAPSYPEINGSKKGVPDILYNFTFKSVSPINNDLYYWIEWGDNKGTGWIGPYPSGQEITIGHEWWTEKTYTIKARCKDINNLWGLWNTFDITIPRNKAVYNSLFLRFLERFPLLKEVLLRIINH